jgi:hypothetical protein
MKTLLLAAALALTATTASAGTVKLPDEYLGTWCVDYKDAEVTVLTRVCTSDANTTTIGQNNIDGCNLVRGRREETGNAETYVMLYRCGKPQRDWRVNILMKHGDVILRRGGK